MPVVIRLVIIMRYRGALTLRVGDEVNPNVDHQRILSSVRRRRLKLSGVKGLFCTQRQRQFARLGLEVACVHRRAVALRYLDSLVPEPAGAVDEDALLGARTKLSDK